LASRSAPVSMVSSIGMVPNVPYYCNASHGLVLVIA